MKSCIKFVLLCGIFVVATYSAGDCSREYFSSVDSLFLLGDIELTLVASVRKYLDMQKKHLENYRKFLYDIEENYVGAMDSAEEFLGDPLYAFQLIKRLVVDWNEIHRSVLVKEAKSALSEEFEDIGNEETIPNQSEVRGAVKGLARLQQVYKLNASDLALGNIGQNYYGSELSWHDCLEIASNLIDEKQFTLAISWLNVTKNLLEESREDAEFNKGLHQHLEKFYIDTLEYLAIAFYELGSVAKAFEYIGEILDIQPDHNAKTTLNYMKNSSTKKPHTEESDNDEYIEEYIRLCEANRLPEAAPQSKLHCRVATRGKPYFILAPLKIEELNEDPEITIYHGMLNDEQIEKIHLEAEDNMQRSRVGSDEGVVLDVRVSQHAGLNYTSSAVMGLVSRLITQLTGLDMRNAEPMQVANYGIGGHYDPHYDFFGTNHTTDTSEGDRLVTNMFYLSDVDQGGYTVFPEIDVILRPVKGSLVVWYNLHRSLEPDQRTLHASCPVIVGSKRISNVWIHSHFQEFARPCALVPDSLN